MALKTIRNDRRRLADKVYRQLLDAIISREIGPDDQLIQQKLAEEMQISRTPVREALFRLEQEGVLRSSPRGGFVLYHMKEPEIRELYQARAAIEGQAARILAARQDRKTLEKLRKTILREENLREKTVRAYFEANRNIHSKFVELTGNRFLSEMFNMIWGKAMAFHLFSAIPEEDLEKSLRDHMTLVDVIATGDRTEALEIHTAHIQDGFDLQIKSLAQN